ncbi:MAG: DUF2892 domain-containing protein [Firmicutes bacterium]|nr:DUF2892 domain-containing protein [Bacillota bacterium]
MNLPERYLRGFVGLVSIFLAVVNPWSPVWSWAFGIFGAFQLLTLFTGY